MRRTSLRSWWFFRWADGTEPQENCQACPLKNKGEKMKTSLCQINAVVCTLIVGCLGVFSIVKNSEAHPSHKAYTHTEYTCYVIEDDGFGEICTSYTDTGYRPVYPSNHYTDGGTHIPHDYEDNTHEYDTENYSRSSCSEC